MTTTPPGPPQFTPDYTLGYAAGTRAARRYSELSDTALTAKAKLAAGRASRALALDREEFVNGYITAYQQRREPHAT